MRAVKAISTILVQVYASVTVSASYKGIKLTGFSFHVCEMLLVCIHQCSATQLEGHSIHDNPSATYLRNRRPHFLRPHLVIASKPKLELPSAARNAQCSPYFPSPTLRLH